MKKILLLLAVNLLFGFSDVWAAHGSICSPPMNNVPIPMTHVFGQHGLGVNRWQGNPTACPPQPGLYYRYPVVPLYAPLVQPQETIDVEIVTAEGLNQRDGRSRRVQFYIGVCHNGQIWCQAGVTPARFSSEYEAYRFVEWVFCLRDLSLRKIRSDPAGRPWYVN